MTHSTPSQPHVPRPPIGTTFTASITVLGVFLVVQFFAVIWKFLPQMRDNIVRSATEQTVEPAATPAAAPVAPAQSETPFRPQPQEDATVARISQLVAESDKSFRVGDYDTALKTIQEADALLPEDPGVLLRMARIHETALRPAEASDIYTRVIALPNLPPELRSQAARKLELLANRLPAQNPAAAGRGSDRTAIIDETGPDIRDEIGLQPGAQLGIVDIRMRDGAPGTKVLRVAIKSRPGKDIDVRQMKLHVFFYEKDDMGETLLTESKLSTQWISPPVNWKENEPELLDVTYVLPESELPGSSSSNGSPGRAFEGYIIGVYYNGELQDTRADPGQLAKKFPLPLYLKQENP